MVFTIVNSIEFTLRICNKKHKNGHLAQSFRDGGSPMKPSFTVCRQQVRAERESEIGANRLADMPADGDT